jgi:hypothetical protein
MQEYYLPTQMIILPVVLMLLSLSLSLMAKLVEMIILPGAHKLVKLSKFVVTWLEAEIQLTPNRVFLGACKNTPVVTNEHNNISQYKLLSRILLHVNTYGNLAV